MAYEATTDNFQIRNANKVTFVGTSNTIIDTTTGRIQTKGFQHNSNVITDISGPHGRVAPTLKKYPEIIFEDGKFDKNDTTNTYVQAGYTVTASSVLSSVYTPWRIFDDYLSGNDGWATLNRYNASSPGEAQSGLGATQFPAASGRYGEYIDLQLPHGIKVTNFIIKTRPTQSGSGTWMPEDSPGAGYLYGSNNGTTWTEIKAFSGLTYGGMSTNGGTQETVQVDSTVAYKYLRLQVTHRAGQNSSDQYLAIGALEYYGTEEYTPAGDHSVDTTFMSRFNNPQLTGVQVLVDGATGLGTNQISGGVDPSGNNETYDATNKYWTLNGTLTSNLSVEANTFFEGDQPHAVSVWFNSSNLEANVSNTCVFSISDQEKLDSDNLTLQSNTWHNLTYTYQGEGGSKVTYLDGVKVVEGITDTFGDYPPFAMTGLSQGGYVVSASSEYATYNVYDGFDHIQSANGISNHWSGSTIKYNTDGTWGGDTSSVYTTDVEGVNKFGEWVQIQLPNRIKYNYSTIKAPYDAPGRQPRDGYIVGCNNPVGPWTSLHRFEDVTRSGGTDTVTYTPPSAPTKAFKYIRLVIESMSSGTGRYAGIDEWKLYGHRENDLVRLPDPTNVLKYPHVALTGPAQRGYVVDQSNYSGYPADGYAWGLFDNSTSGYQSASVYSSGNATGSTPTTTASDTSTHQGVTITLQVPNKIRLNYITIQSHTNYGRTPVSGTFLGSNNNNTWDIIEEFSGLTTTTSSQIHNINVTNATSKPYYRYLRLVVKTIHTSAVFNGGGLLEFSELEFYGTEEGSIPLQIGGGNIDKVANFRVYDKFVGEDQALEIWDAQKDYFGRAKSSMTLHKGRLGIGTTEPTSSLDVSGTFQGNSPLRFFVLTGTFPTSGNTQDVTVLPQDLINRIYNIVSMNGLTINSDGDQVNWNQNGSTTWEVDIKADVSVPKFVLSGFDASHVNISGKKWRMFIVTT